MITFRLVTEKELDVVRELAAEIFPHTYGAIISAEQIGYMMEMMYSRDSLRRQMSEEGQVFHLICIDGEPCGYFSLQPRMDGIVVLQKLYLMPSMQGKGLGRAMLDEAVLYVRKTYPEANAMQLYVNRENRAKEFYLRYGFRIIATRDNPIGNGYFMNDYIMEFAVV